MKNFPALERERGASSCLGAFTIDVYNFLHLFDHPPTFVYNFYAINIYKFSRFLTTHPPSIVNVICERPLIQLLEFYEWNKYMYYFIHKIQPRNFLINRTFRCAGMMQSFNFQLRYQNFSATRYVSNNIIYWKICKSFFLFRYW